MSDATSEKKPKPARAKKRRRTGRPRIERVHHVVEIQSWTWDYMFGLDETRFRTGPFYDFRFLTLKGKLVRPLSISATEVEVDCSPHTDLSDRKLSDPPPKGVGWISHRGKDYRANLHVPSDAFSLILQMMIAERYQYVFMEAEKSFRGEAPIRSFRFSKTVEDDELD